MLFIRRLSSLAVGNIFKVSLAHLPRYQFAYMSLFQPPKTKQQLDPVFKRQIKQKGHLKAHRKHGRISVKKNQKTVKSRIRLKNHRGLLKRIKIVGPRWNRQFKFRSPGLHHLRRNKSRANIARKRRPRYIAKADIWRVRKMLPYFKRQKLKQRY